MSAPIDQVREALEDAGCSPQRNSARCPAHDDRNPSLTFNEGDDGRALVHCHAGCTSEQVIAALGLEPKDLFTPDDDWRRSMPSKKRPVKIGELRTESIPNQVLQGEDEDLLELARNADPREVSRLQLQLGRAHVATFHSLDSQVPPGVPGALLLKMIDEARQMEDPYSRALARRLSENLGLGVLAVEHAMRHVDYNPAADDPLTGKLVSWDEMAERAGPTWLVEGVLPRAGVAMLWGPSGSYKSFIALDLAAHVCLGWDWCGRPVTKPLGDFTHNRVLYVSGEGNPANRVRAWQVFHRQQGLGAGFWFLEQGVNLMDPQSVWDVAESAGHRHYTLVVVDTLARSIVGADENSSQEMGQAMKALDTIVQASGATVLVVHHTGKDPTRRERGSGSIRAAADASLPVARRGDLRVSVGGDATKQRDFEETEGIPLRLRQIGWYDHRDERDCSSLVVVSDDSPVPAADGSSEQFAQAESGARRYCDEHGELPSIRMLMDDTGVTYYTAQRVLKRLKEQESHTAPDIPTGGE